MLKNIPSKRGYRNLIDSIGELRQHARQKAFQQVNNILVRTYWEIGRHLISYEQHSHERAQYGSHLLDKLSKDLKQLYGKGFSRRNVLNMRNFYLNYPKWQAVPAVLSWTHIVSLLSVEDILARSFYEKECITNHWSTRELERQINSMLFERLALSKDKKGVLNLAKRGHPIKEAKDIIKDPYVLEFLGIPEDYRYSEKELEQKIIDNMHMYLNYFKKEEMAKEENDPIGIVLGAEKDHILVEYALGGISNKLFASKYRLTLPDKYLLQKAVEAVFEPSIVEPNVK